MSGRSYIREQRTLCGERYMEVDIYQISASEHKAVRKAKTKGTTPAARRVNDRNARRYLQQLLKTNFTAKDIHITLTYHDDHLPENGDAAAKDLTNYLRRVEYAAKNAGVPKPMFVAVTEWRDADPKEGIKAVRPHHHIVMHTALSRDRLEELWSTGRTGHKEALGLVTSSRLDMRNGLEDLASYLIKIPNRKRRWRQSRGLRAPLKPRPNDSRYTKSKISRMARSGDIYRADHWQKLYPGYRVTGVTVAEPDDWRTWAVVLKMEKLKTKPIGE